VINHGRDAVRDDEAGLRAAIESLLVVPVPASREPASSTADAQVPAEAGRRVASVAGASIGPTPWVDQATGAYRAPMWALFVARAAAEWERFGRAMVVVQLEVAGHREIAERLGGAAASHVMAELASAAHTTTRASDAYGRVQTWRLQGLLPETDASGGERCAERIGDAFRLRLGSSLPIRLLVGTAPAVVGRSIPDALGEAERTMYDELPRSDPAVKASPPGSVRQALLELDGLRADGSIGDAEYEAMRSAILARL